MGHVLRRAHTLLLSTGPPGFEHTGAPVPGHTDASLAAPKASVNMSRPSILHPSPVDIKHVFHNCKAVSLTVFSICPCQLPGGMTAHRPFTMQSFVHDARVRPQGMGGEVRCAPSALQLQGGRRGAITSSGFVELTQVTSPVVTS